MKVISATTSGMAASGSNRRRSCKGYSTNTMLLSQRVVLNIGGQRFHTYFGTLTAIPHTRLCWLAQKHPFSPEYDHANEEYFFDRNAVIFHEVLNYYRTGQLHCPTHICASQFQEELAFWGINPQNMEPCCWVNYKNHIKNEKCLQSCAKDKQERNVSTLIDVYQGDVQASNESCVDKVAFLWKKYKRIAWTVLEKPNSTTASKVFAVFSSIFIILMLLQFCLRSLPHFLNAPKRMNTLDRIFEISSLYFTLEFLIRVLFCPSKAKFLKSCMNWVDFLTVLPYLLSFVSEDERTVWLIPLKTIRLYRLFSLSTSFQIMLKAILASVSELILGLGTIIIPVIIFSCFIYLAEKDTNSEMFGNALESFWWAIVTMTTLGYGDKVPVTGLGKLIGVTCALCGVVIIALPISVVGNNFYLLYTQARTRKKKPSKETIASAVAHIPLINLRVLGSTADSCDSGPPCDEDDVDDDEDDVIRDPRKNSLPKTRRKLVTIS